MRIIEDLKQHAQGSTLRMINTLFLNPNFHCVMWFRLANWLGKFKPLVICSKLIMYLNRVIYSVDIDYRAELAGGFMLVHGIGTVIGKGVKTEGPVKIYQGVTLGGNSNKRRIVQNREFSQPWLKDGVIVYANATVIGPVIIECGSVVGTNAVITKDVSEGCVVYTKVEMVIKR